MNLVADVEGTCVKCGATIKVPSTTEWEGHAFTVTYKMAEATGCEHMPPQVEAFTTNLRIGNA